MWLGGLHSISIHCSTRHWQSSSVSIPPSSEFLGRSMACAKALFHQSKIHSNFEPRYAGTLSDQQRHACNHWRGTGCDRADELEQRRFRSPERSAHHAARHTVRTLIMVGLHIIYGAFFLNLLYIRSWWVMVTIGESRPSLNRAAPCLSLVLPRLPATPSIIPPAASLFAL